MNDTQAAKDVLRDVQIALEAIVACDYRGNMPMEQGIALRALNELRERRPAVHNALAALEARLAELEKDRVEGDRLLESAWRERDDETERAMAAEARVVAAEAERDELRDACHLTAKSAERRLERAEAAEGRLQAATDALQEAHDLLAAYPSIHSDQSGFAHGNAREILATALARAVLVGGTEDD